MILSSKLISLAKGLSEDAARAEATRLLRSGEAKAKLMEIVRAEGGDLALFSEEKRKEIFAEDAGSVFAEKCGYLKKIDCVSLGVIARKYEEKGGNGIGVPFKIGDPIEKGAALAVLKGKVAVEKSFLQELSACFEISKTPVDPLPLVYGIVD